MRGCIRSFLAMWFRAVILGSLFALAGCSTFERSSIAQTIVIFDPDRGQATAEQAENIAFASITLNTSVQRGLVVLGAQTGEQTHWPISAGGFLSLYQGGLYAVATPQGDLLTTRYGLPEEANAGTPWQLAAPANFSIERHWVDSDGLSHAQRAEGTMTCGEPQRRELLLTELVLESCHVDYTWDSGQTTRAQWWRDPATLRLWEVDEAAWPQGPDISWQVARPWWGS